MYLEGCTYKTKNLHSLFWLRRQKGNRENRKFYFDPVYRKGTGGTRKFNSGLVYRNGTILYDPPPYLALVP